MSHSLLRLAAFGLFTFASVAEAVPVTLTIEGTLTAAQRVIDCPVASVDCYSGVPIEAINTPITATLTYDLQATAPLSGENHQLDGTGNPIGLYSSIQYFANDGAQSAEFAHPLLIPDSLALANPITSEYWNQHTDQPATQYSEYVNATLNRELIQNDDTQQPVLTQSLWSLSTAQNWYVTEGPPYNNVQYVSVIGLGGNAGLALNPDNVANPYDNDGFLALIAGSAQCGYCLSLNLQSSIYDTQFTGLMSNYSYFGTARLVAIDGQSTEVPEPATNVLMLAACAGLLYAVRRRRAGRP